MKKLGFAIHGIFAAVKSEGSMQIHLIASSLVIAAAIFFHLTAGEWCIILLCIGLVWAAELLNTAIEHTIDLCSPEWNERAGKAKDIAAGGVLIVSIIAVIIGCIIFIPKISLLIS